MDPYASKPVTYGTISTASTLLRAGGAIDCAASNGTLAIGGSNTATLQLSTSNAVRLTVNAAGNVGVGTTAPTDNLHVASKNGQTNLRIQSTDGGANNEVIYFGSSFAGLSNADKVTANIFGAPENSGGRLGMCTTDNAGVVQERLRITSTGNVGIGTALPSSTLDINAGTIASSGAPSSTLRLRNTVIPGIKNPTSFGIDIGAIGPNLLDPARVDFKLSSSPTASNNYGTIPDTTVVTMTGTGNVGIGTAAPSTTLTVAHTASALDWTKGIRLGDVTVPTGKSLSWLQHTHTASNACRLDINSVVDGVSYMPVCLATGGGTVGIGTTSPWTSLHVNNGSITVTNFYQNGGSHSGYAGSRINLQTNLGYGTEIRTRVPPNNTVNQSDLQFLTCDNSGNQIVRMTILGSSGALGGFVGIGTDAPSIKLDVAGTNIGIGRTRNWGSPHDADKRDGLWIGRWDGTHGSPGISGPSGDFCGMAPRVVTGASVGEPYDNQSIISFYTWGNTVSVSREVMRITSGGACLNVANSYGSLSDERIKENIADARGYLEDLRKIRIVKYSLKDEKRAEADKLGVIAQEVAAVFPGMTETMDFGEHVGVMGVKMSVFTPMLIKAVQELATENAELRSTVNRMKAFLADKYPGEFAA